MSWLSWLVSGRSTRSAEVASERLQMVLKYDRAKLPPGLVDALKDELVAVVSRYLEVAEEGAEVTLSSPGTRSGAPMALVANVPVRGPRRSVAASHR